MVKEKNAPLILASLSSILSFICLIIALQLPPNTSSNVLGTTSSNLVPCSVINNWQKQYCSNIGPTVRPTSIPTPPAITNCSNLYSSQKALFDMCSKNGYSRICFDKYTSQYQGCISGTQDTCTLNNTNAVRNILCSSTYSTPSPYYPTPTPVPTTRTVTPTGIGISGLQITRSCNSNGTFNFTVSGYLNPPPSYVNGIHYLVMNNSTGKYYHQGYQAGSNLPVRVAVSAAGYLTDTNGYLSEPTYSKNSYTIHFVDAAYNTPVSWTSPYISSYFIPSSPGGCPVVVTVTPTRAPTITPTRVPSPVPTVRISIPTPHL